MTIHLCRDFLTHVSASSPGTNMYLLTLFVNHVLGFGIESNVNFDVESSTYLKGQHDVLAGDLRFGSINILTGSEYTVFLPTGSYSPSSSDIGRILALRSDANPRHNSGLFRITSINTSSAVLGVGFGIDFRSPDFPPYESGSLAWTVFEAENVVASLWSSGSNGSTGYSSSGISDASRIMFETPAGYNLRFCLESLPDRSGTIPGGFSIAPGVESVERADFVGTQGFLHGPMWYDTRSSDYRGTAVGLPAATITASSSWTTGQWRFTALGDTDTSSVAVITRNVSLVSGGTGLCVFGLPENESSPLLENIIDRVFVIGYGNNYPNLTWNSGFFNDGHAQGLAWSRYGFPTPCIMSSYADVRNLDPHVRNSQTSKQTPFLNAYELVGVTLLAGTLSSSLAYNGAAISQLAPRVLGRLPLLRQGASSFIQWATTPDKTWLHTQDGIFIPWSGPAASGSLSGSLNATDITNSDADGLQFFEPNPPMEDPISDVVVTSVTNKDVDAVRFQKTYSYYRQPTINVGVIKGGSNTSK